LFQNGKIPYIIKNAGVNKATHPRIPPGTPSIIAPTNIEILNKGPGRADTIEKPSQNSFSSSPNYSNSVFIRGKITWPPPTIIDPKE